MNWEPVSGTRASKGDADRASRARRRAAASFGTPSQGLALGLNSARCTGALEVQEVKRREYGEDGRSHVFKEFSEDPTRHEPMTAACKSFT